MTSRACPLCATTAANFICEQRYFLEQDSPLPRHTDIVSCPACGFVYARSDKNGEDYKNYYTAQTRYESTVDASGSGEYALDRNRISELVDLLAENTNLNANVLDIGAAKGGVLKELMRRGYKNLYGMDPAQACVDTINALGIKAGKANLEDEQWPFDPKQFDLIILSHVFEHVFDVQECLRKIQQRLSSNGRIYVEVPDAARYTTNGFPAFYFFDPEHINHFDLSSLTTLAANNNLSIEKSRHRNLDVGVSTLYPAIGAFMVNSVVVDAGVDLEQPASGQNTDDIHEGISCADAISAYVEESEAVLKLDDKFKTLALLAERKTPVVIWGAGSYCRRLLASSPLADAHLLGIIDNDSGKQGKQLAGVKVCSSEHGLAIAREQAATIVVAIAVNSDALVAELKHSEAGLDLLVL